MIFNFYVFNDIIKMTTLNILVINDLLSNFAQNHTKTELCIGNLERTNIRIPTNIGNYEIKVQHRHYSVHVSVLSDLLNTINGIIICTQKLTYNDIHTICTRIRAVDKNRMIILECGNIDLNENHISSQFYKYNPIILWCTETRWYGIIREITNQYVYCPVI